MLRLLGYIPGNLQQFTANSFTALLQKLTKDTTNNVPEDIGLITAGCGVTALFS